MDYWIWIIECLSEKPIDSIESDRCFCRVKCSLCFCGWSSFLFWFQYIDFIYEGNKLISWLNKRFGSIINNIIDMFSYLLYILFEQSLNQIQFCKNLVHTKFHINSRPTSKYKILLCVLLKTWIASSCSVVNFLISRKYQVWALNQLRF